MTFTSRFTVGEYGCFGTVQLRKPVSCISMADDFPFAHPGAVGIGVVLFDADVIVGAELMGNDRPHPAMWMAFCWL